jgi:perosamine synthetase
MKPLFVSLSPNIEKDDLKLAFYLLLRPWQWQKFVEKEKELEEKIKNFLGVKRVFLFNSGRSGWLAILKALNLEKGSEVLIQGFTCNAVVNPIIWAGLKPVFVDIEEETLNLDPQDLERKITAKSKVVLVQHTFGKPADLETILKICQKNHLFLIEDGAHSLGLSFQGRLLGTFGKAAFFSFGRDKLISSVFGGAVVTNDDSFAKNLEKFQKELSYPSFFWVFQQICHPLLSEFLIKPLYSLNSSLGKFFLIFLQKINILSKSVSDEEKEGERPNFLFLECQAL